MFRKIRSHLTATVLTLGLACVGARADEVLPPSAETVQWFQKTEQALMDSVAIGGKDLWDRIMDPDCVITSEEGEVTDKHRFLEDLRPLPQGLTGGLTVKDLTVQEFRDFAVVRYLADEWESVFGQKLTTKYRTTDTFRRDGTQWKLVASHVAVVTKDPAPQQVSNVGWGKLTGRYRLLPDGWTFTVTLRDGKLFGGRNPQKLKPLIPLSSDVFVLSGSLGEWIFVADAKGRVTHIVDFRKFEPLIWTKVESAN